MHPLYIIIWSLILALIVDMGLYILYHMWSRDLVRALYKDSMEDVILILVWSIIVICVCAFVYLFLYVFAYVFIGAPMRW